MDLLFFSSGILFYSSEIFCYIYSPCFVVIMNIIAIILCSLHSVWLLSFILINNRVPYSTCSNIFQLILLGQFYYLILLLCLFSLPLHIMSLLCLTTLVKASRKMLDNAGSIRPPCLISDCNEAASIPSLLFERDTFCHVK